MAVTAFTSCGGSPNCSPVWFGSSPAAPLGPTAISPVVAGDLVYVTSAAGHRHQTQVNVYRAGGCGDLSCSPLTSIQATGDPVELLVADGPVILHTTSGIRVYSLVS